MQIMKASNEDALLRFVRDFTAGGGRLDQSQAVMLPQGGRPRSSLALYADREKPSAPVLARHTLLQGSGGRFRPEVEDTLRWLVLYTSVEPHRGTIESLHDYRHPRPLAGRDGAAHGQYGEQPGADPVFHGAGDQAAGAGVAHTGRRVPVPPAAPALRPPP